MNDCIQLYPHPRIEDRTKYVESSSGLIIVTLVVTDDLVSIAKSNNGLSLPRQRQP